MENQLSPRLDSLSLLAISHPPAILQVGSALHAAIHKRFSLLMARSRGFGFSLKTLRVLIRTLAFTTPTYGIYLLSLLQEKVADPLYKRYLVIRYHLGIKR